MASKSKQPRPARKKPSPNQLPNLGLFDIPNLDIEDNDDDDSDIDEDTLQSELDALMRGESPVKRNKPKPKVNAPVDIFKLAEDCLKDDDEEDDGDLSGDEELLKELLKLAPEVKSEEVHRSEEVISENEPSNTSSPSEINSGSLVDLLQERLHLYTEALNIAKQNNDTSKARRYVRAVKTLEGQLKSAKSGAAINDEDIPPIVSIPKVSSKSIPHPVNIPESDKQNLPQSKHVAYDKNDASLPVVETSKTNVTSLLISRRGEYKKAALEAKKAGNKELAIKYMKSAKTFDAVIEAAEKNEPVDLTHIPPPLQEYQDSNTQTTEIGSQKRMHEQVQTASAIEVEALAAANDEDAPQIFSAPNAPTTVLEALQQRLEKYSLTKKAAESEGNSGKVRRLQRIVKTYETAIQNWTAGKKVDFDELPTPPGFGPIPVAGASNVAPTIPSNQKTPESKVPSGVNSSTKPIVPAGQSNVPMARKPKVQRTNTTAEKQLEFLLERQKLFRQAAYLAKTNGDMQQAKEYLRCSKGFVAMIEASKCGLPIDVTTIPTPPQLETDFEVVDISECAENSDASQEDLFESLEKDLCQQLEICSTNKEHFLRLGDVSSSAKFEKLALETKKDLSVIQHLRKKGEAVPKFHYETRLFSMVLCHTDLTDNDLEVTVERGINFPGKPDELDSYVRIECPIPTEAPQRAKTHTVRNTNNPVFEEIFKFEINRKSRSQLRLFKRHYLKLEVWSKGGFLRNDTLLGTVNVKLLDLESKCSVHDCYNLMDGKRKTSGGKLEVKMRIRDPLLVKQVEEVREKWLVIGS